MTLLVAVLFFAIDTDLTVVPAVNAAFREYAHIAHATAGTQTAVGACYIIDYLASITNQNQEEKTMQWKFNETKNSIRNTEHGVWEIELGEVTTPSQLLDWLLQARAHLFDLNHLVDLLGEKALSTFTTQHGSGSHALQEIYCPRGIPNSAVDWNRGTFSRSPKAPSLDKLEDFFKASDEP